MSENNIHNSIRVITAKTSRADLKRAAEEGFGDMVKAVIDVVQGIMAIGGDLHADEEALLLEQGSQQENLWGINIYPEAVNENFVEFDSMINIRPRQNNRSRGVENEDMRTKIKQIVDTLVE